MSERPPQSRPYRRATAVALAKEGADAAITYLKEDDDARRTARLVEAAGRRCSTSGGDMGEERHCLEVVEQAVLDMLRSAG